MSIAEGLLPELDAEMAATRRLLERVPFAKAEWRPHPKSFPLGHLAQLVARMPGWNVFAMRDTKLDLGGPYPGYSFEKTDKLIAEFDRNVREAREAIASAKDADFLVPWSLTHGDKTFFTMPRLAIVRQNISHLIHHRGQLTVYLRLLDVPIPMLYGPTADEKWS